MSENKSSNTDRAAEDHETSADGEKLKPSTTEKSEETRRTDRLPDGSGTDLVEEDEPEAERDRYDAG